DWPRGNNACDRSDDARYCRHDGPRQHLAMTTHCLLFDPGFSVTQPPLDEAFGDGFLTEAADGCDRPAGALQKAGANNIDASGFKRAQPSFFHQAVWRAIILFGHDCHSHLPPRLAARIVHFVGFCVQRVTHELACRTVPNLDYFVGAVDRCVGLLWFYTM